MVRLLIVRAKDASGKRPTGSWWCGGTNLSRSTTPISGTDRSKFYFISVPAERTPAPPRQSLQKLRSPIESSGKHVPACTGQPSEYCTCSSTYHSKTRVALVFRIADHPFHATG